MILSEKENFLKSLTKIRYKIGSFAIKTILVPLLKTNIFRFKTKHHIKGGIVMGFLTK